MSSTSVTKEKELRCQYCGRRIMKNPIIQTIWKDGKISIGYVYCSRECALAASL